jgi:carboxylesterase type B
MNTNVIVKTRMGDVGGCVADGVNVFKGIPYAAPPFGTNRLLPPQPAARWSGVREALAFGPKSPQLPYPPPVDVMIPEFVGPGEDCLTLNVWSSAVGAGRQPVMVWIPGGVFEYHGTGAAPWYDGARFARDGIVCVTINYRVGAEGFLYFGAGSANRGLLDQIAALQWVQQNIAAFGGDADNVTVFGESAGSMSIASLLSMPRARGLFRRAILQSGAAHPVMAAQTARRVCELLAARLGVPATREAIAALPVDRLLRAQAGLRSDLEADPDPQRWGQELVLSMMPWHPVIDGDVVRAHPLDRIDAGAAAEIDVIVGTNAEEHRVFLVSVGAIDRVTQQALEGAVAAYGLPLDPALAFYRAAHPRASAGDLLAAVQTDWFWRIPAVRLADAHAKSARAGSTFMYEFAWRSPQFNNLLGACHSLEIPFVFDTLGRGTEPMWGSAPPQPLADAMHAKWVAFAKTGDCGWPKYDLSRRATMRFDVTSTVVDDPRRQERMLWGAAREHFQPVG